MGDSLEVRDLGLNTTSGHQSPRGTIIGLHYDDPPFVVLTETKFSFRCIPVWDLYSPHQTRVEKKSTCDNAREVDDVVTRNLGSRTLDRVGPGRGEAAFQEVVLEVARGDTQECVEAGGRVLMMMSFICSCRNKK